MASTESEQPAHESSKTESESQLPSPPPFNLFMVDFTLRLLLFASTITAIVVMVSSKQTELILPFMLTSTAKFNYSPALIYFVVALGVACLYGIFTSIASIFSILRPSLASPTKLLFILVILDALMAALVASATGASASVAYIGLRGNSHVGWIKVCNIFDKFCRHIAGSIVIALVASIVLLLLVFLSLFSLYRRIS